MTYQVGDGNPDGIALGASASEKVGFYGVTPVIQASTTTAPVSTAATSTSPYGFATSTQADAIVTWVRAVDTALKNIGIIASA